MKWGFANFCATSEFYDTIKSVVFVHVLGIRKVLFELRFLGFRLHFFLLPVFGDQLVNLGFEFFLERLCLLPHAIEPAAGLRRGETKDVLLPELVQV